MDTPELSFLTPEQLVKYHKDGYLVIESFIDEPTRLGLLERADELLATLSLADHPGTKFTTGDGDDHVGDDYFLSSGDKIRYFFEADGKTVNKIGHALHELDSVYRDFSLNNDRIKAVIRDLGVFRDPRVLQSMLIFKHKSVGGAVPAHQDGTFLYTDPPSAVGLWFALEDCTPDNGCLYFLPGSQDRPVHSRFVRLPSGGTGFETIPGHEAAKAAADAEGWDDAAFVCAPCKAGALVLIGNVGHKSARNASDKSRYAYTFHAIEGPDDAVYDEKNWLQPTEEMPFTKLFP